MGARDNVLYHATIAASTPADTVVPLSLLYGIENVRQGYGTPVLKNIRAIYAGGYNNNFQGVEVVVKNSNWIDSASFKAQKISDGFTLSRNSLAFMRGRDKVLQPNTSWIVNAVLPVTTTAIMDLYVIFEIEYTDVPGKPSAEILAGSPVTKLCKNAAVTAAANVATSIGTFDNLLQGVRYVMSEASINSPTGNSTADGSTCWFMILEGFSNQRGLTRIFPVRNFGMAEQIEGSVELTKQTYNLSLITSTAISALPVEFALEMIASNN